MRLKKIFITLLCIILIIIALVFYFHPFRPTENTAHEQIGFAKMAWDQFKNAPKFTFNKQNALPLVVAGENAKFDVFLFFDFNCEPCNRQLKFIKKISEEKNLNLYLLLYPLSFYCNPNVSSKGEVYSCYYSQFLRCVEKQKANLYEAIVNLNQLTQTNKIRDPLQDIQKISKQMNIENETMKTCLQDPEWTKLKQFVFDKNLQNQSLSLPILVVNDKIFLGTQSYEAVDYFFKQLFD